MWIVGIAVALLIPVAWILDRERRERAAIRAEELATLARLNIFIDDMREAPTVIAALVEQQASADERLTAIEKMLLNPRAQTE